MEKYQVKDEKIELGDVKYVEQRPYVAPFSKKPNNVIVTESQEELAPRQERSDAGRPHVAGGGVSHLDIHSK